MNNNYSTSRRNKIPSTWRAYVLGLALMGIGLPGQSAELFDTALAWPLCGRIVENYPSWNPSWNPAQGCPVERWGNALYSDDPVSSPFGPRPLVSGDFRYDFHRGIDIPTPSGTPVFAITDGEVRIAGNTSGYSDPLVQLRHFRPGSTSCVGVGCYHSNYMHLSSWVVNPGDLVGKGQLLGYTGISASGFKHLHFEIRDAPSDDPFSNWSRDAINPLGVLPYDSVEGVALQINSVTGLDTGNPQVEVTITSPRADIVRVELALYNSRGKEINQPGNSADSRGYNVHPSWFDMDIWNFQYSHKDSANVPWESFGAGGVNECPFHGAHGASYDANVHMDAEDPNNFRNGLFNGVRVRPDLYHGSYYLNLTFMQLTGPADCVVATAYPLNATVVSVRSGNCRALDGRKGNGKK